MLDDGEQNLIAIGHLRDSGDQKTCSKLYVFQSNNLIIFKVKLNLHYHGIINLVNDKYKNYQVHYTN